jgi:hypothetical protein
MQPPPLSTAASTKLPLKFSESPKWSNYSSKESKASTSPIHRRAEIFEPAAMHFSAPEKGEDGSATPIWILFLELSTYASIHLFRKTLRLLKEQRDLPGFRTQNAAWVFLQFIVRGGVRIDEYVGRETCLHAVAWPLYFLMACAALTGVATTNVWKLAKWAAKDEFVDFCLSFKVSYALVPLICSANLQLSEAGLPSGCGRLWKVTEHLSVADRVTFGQSGEASCLLRCELDLGMMPIL